MPQDQSHHYNRITEAIRYLGENFRSQPDLDELASKMHLSSFHFQRLFTEWAGVSPKKFLQYISVEHAKAMLRERATLMDAAFETGLSGTGRLHDLFIHIEGMTPGEYKNGGAALSIQYAFAATQFGPVIVASTSRGVCYMAFYAEETIALEELKQKFPGATFSRTTDTYQQEALKVFSGAPAQVKLHLKGTPFQLKVWEALLKIPPGQLSSYSLLAQQIAHTKASRAVGSAVGDNPVAYIIPCHRVIQASGIIGQYHWGSVRKASMIGWEAALHERHL
ncbi:MAG: methylated-DNA--[protein]-cysteine S-methyltransferase [Chitinophagaceae bacterium]